MTKLYFHSATRVSSGTLPSAEQSTLTSVKDVDSQTLNRSMDPDKGTSQTSIVLASNASASAQTYYFARFVSGELKGAQTISANTWNYAYAVAENNANANFPVGAASTAVPINVYVWRPSTGAKVGTILDGNTAASFSEPASTNTETSEFGTFSGSSVSAADKDVIIAEVWFTTTQGNATSRNDTFYFDGTTETNNVGTTVSNHASYVETPQTLAFYIVKTLVETVTITDSAALHIIPGTSQANVSAKKGTITLDTTSGAHDQSFTGVGFQPKALIIWGVGVTNESFNEGIVHSFGMSDGTTHGAIGGGQVDASATNAHMIRNDAIIEQVSPTTPSTVVVRASVKTLDSDGFTLTYASKTDTTAYVFHYLAIGGSDISNVKVKHETAGTTATGNASYTGMGFKPNAMVFASAFPADTVNTNTTSVALNVGCGTGSTSQFCVVQGRDTSTGCECQFNDNRVLFGQTPNFQNIKLNSSLVSLDSDGYTLNHTIAPTTGLPWFYLAIKGGYWDCGVFTQKTSTGTLVTGFKYDTKPVALFLGAINTATANSNQTSSVSTSLGAADDSLNQGCIAWGNDGAGSNFPVKVSLTSAITRSFTPVATATSSTINAEGDINDMSTNGQFTLDWTTANATARKLGFLVLTKTIATANNITRSLTETVTIGESIARQTAKVRTRSESVTISETPARVAAKNRTLSAETITVGGGSLVRTKGSNRPVNESVTVTGGTLARVCAKTRTRSETVTIGESATRQANKIRTLSTETVTVGGGTLSRIANKIRSRSETVTIGESLARQTAKFRTLASETVTVTGGTLNRIKGVNRTFSETVSISESLARLKRAFRTLATQTVSVSESLVRQTAKIRALAAQTVSISDSISRQSQKTRSSSETVSISDSLAIIRNKIRSISETVSISDSLTRQAAKVRTLATETVTITDSVSRLVGARLIVRTLTETVSISDSISRVVSKTRPILETTFISESLTRQASKIRTISQTVSISDSVVGLKIRAVVRTLTETVDVSDSVTRLAAKTRSLIQSVTVGESLARQTAKTRSITQSTSISDSISRLKSATRALPSQTVIISDSIVRIVSKVRTLSDTVIVSAGSVNRLVSKTRAIIETISISDSVTASKTSIREIVRSLVETVTISDSVTRQSAKIRTIVENVTIGPGVVNRARGIRKALATEVVLISDQVSRLAQKTRSLIETVPISDSLSAAVNGNVFTAVKRSLNRVYVDLKWGVTSNNSRALTNFPGFNTWISKFFRMKFKRYP